MKVKTNNVPKRNRNILTEGKEYEFTLDNLYTEVNRAYGHIINDDGNRMLILLQECAFLDDKAWEVVEE